MHRTNAPARAKRARAAAGTAGHAGAAHDRLAGTNGAAINGLARHGTRLRPGWHSGPGRHGRLTGRGPRSLLQTSKNIGARRHHRTRTGLAGEAGTRLGTQWLLSRRQRFRSRLRGRTRSNRRAWPRGGLRRTSRTRRRQNRAAGRRFRSAGARTRHRRLRGRRRQRLARTGRQRLPWTRYDLPWARHRSRPGRNGDGTIRRTRMYRHGWGSGGPRNWRWVRFARNIWRLNRPAGRKRWPQRRMNRMSLYRRFFNCARGGHRRFSVVRFWTGLRRSGIRADRRFRPMLAKFGGRGRACVRGRGDRSLGGDRPRRFVRWSRARLVFSRGGLLSNPGILSPGAVRPAMSICPGAGRTPSEPFSHQDGDLIVDRARVRLLLRHAELGEQVENHLRLNLKLPRQLVDTGLFHSKKLQFVPTPMGLFTAT